MQQSDLVHALERIAVGAVGVTARALTHASPGTELTLPQWRALLVIGEEDDGVRIGTVATRVGVTVPATSRLVRRLERRGLLALSTDARDRRATLARLTLHGRQVRGEIVEFRREILETVAREVGATDHGVSARSDWSGLEAIATELGRYA